METTYFNNTINTDINNVLSERKKSKDDGKKKINSKITFKKYLKSLGEHVLNSTNSSVKQIYSNNIDEMMNLSDDKKKLLNIEDLDECKRINNNELNPSKILIIYTGGTIGMCKNKDGTLFPLKNHLYEYMKNHPNLCDHKHTLAMNKCYPIKFNKNEFNETIKENISNEEGYEDFLSIINSEKMNENSSFVNKNESLNDNNKDQHLNNSSFISNSTQINIEQKIKNEINISLKENYLDEITPFLYTPITQFNKRIAYQILEFSLVFDSSNVNIKNWIQMGKCIYDNYDSYDGFVILHGTDTLSYTASMLSFMFENLSKPVVITGSQIPLIEMSNDGLNNLVDSITIAGTFIIPEVCILFRGNLFRGNRTIKNDIIGLNAFESPNLQPLIKTGTKYRINWDLIRKPPSKNEKFKFFPFLNTNVTIFKYFPTVSDEKIEKLLSDENSGIIIETYGAGNLPSNREVLTNVLAKLKYSNVILINVSQCRKGIVSSIYEVGKRLEELGLIFSGDMTVECALAKLSYLLGKNKSKHEISNLFRKSLRGEVTEEEEQLFSAKKLSNDNLKPSLVIEKSIIKFDDIKSEFFPIFVEYLISTNKSDVLILMKEEIIQFINNSINSIDYPTFLHKACESNLSEIVYFLIEDCKIKVNTLDKFNKTALHYACLNENTNMINYLRKVNAKLNGNDESYGTFFCKIALEKKNNCIKLFYNCEANIMNHDIDKKTIAHIAFITKNLELVLFLKTETRYNLEVFDYFNKTPYDYSDDEFNDLIKEKVK